ncbi:MAG: transposase [Candidatus Binatia bacterium]
MNRGSAQQQTFRSKEDYQAFLITLGETHELWGVEVFSYCLMGNHYHVCLRTPEGNLSRVMRHLDGLYTQRFNRAYSRDGALFRGRYKAIVVDADEYLAAVVRYIHLNPLEAGLVKDPQAYPWSSHAVYLQPCKVPTWLKVQEVLRRFGSSREFHEFVISGNEEAVKEFYSTGRRGPILGGKRFLERIRGRLDKVTREHPRHERVRVRPTVDRVLGIVGEVYETKVEDFIKGGRGRESEARKVAMYVVKRSCDLTLQEIAKQFGVGSYGVVGWACHVVRAKIDSDKKFRSKVERIQSLI